MTPVVAAVVAWLQRAWAWLRVWGMVIAAAAGAIITYLLMRPRKPTLSADTHELERKLDKELALRESTLQAAAKEEQASAQRAHDVSVTSILAKETAAVEVLEADPDSINAYVKDAGRAVRAAPKPKS